MQPEVIREKASNLAADAGKILKVLNRFEDALEETTLNALRKSASEDIELTLQNVYSELEEERQSLFYGEEVYIYSGHSNDATIYYLSATREQKIPELIEKKFLRGKGIICLQVETFKKLMDELKTSISEKELDEQLHPTANQIIFQKIDEASTQIKQLPLDIPKEPYTYQKGNP